MFCISQVEEGLSSAQALEKLLKAAWVLRDQLRSAPMSWFYWPSNNAMEVCPWPSGDTCKGLVTLRKIANQ